MSKLMHFTTLNMSKITHLAERNARFPERHFTFSCYDVCIKDQIHMYDIINIPNPSQEPPATFKAKNVDLKDMDVLCTFKIKIESQNSDHG